jgi:2-polyprenyl-3-methyl-5-hydroxy-6-metoxy-1,4-benzoquinol methylase
LYWTRARQNYFDSALDLLGSMTGGRRLLDLGGGVGFFTERALARGWDAVSLDVSPSVAERAAARVGADRSLTEIPDARLGSFDAMTMWCVVAHTRDPEALIRTARAALAPGGVLWVTTPNFSFQKPYAAVRKRLGRELDFGRDDHVGHFTPQALREMLLRGGFEDARFRFRGITETCVAADSQSRVLVEGKRWWNRLAAGLVRFDVNLMSELQVTARRDQGAAPGQ